MTKLVRTAVVAPCMTARAVALALAVFLTAIALALAMAVLSGDVFAQATGSSKSLCSNVAANAIKPLLDRKGHGIPVSYGRCRLVAGAMDGGVMATNAI